MKRRKQPSHYSFIYIVLSYFVISYRIEISFTVESHDVFMYGPLRIIRLISDAVLQHVEAFIRLQSRIGLNTK